MRYDICYRDNENRKADYDRKPRRPRGGREKIGSWYEVSLD